MQSYTDIPSSQSLQSSLALLLNNDKTALSCSSGSAFPTSNLQVGMLCFRTDLLKLYILKDATPTWSLLWDFAILGTVTNTLTWATNKNISSTDLDVLLTSGFYDGDSLTNAPAAGWWHITVQTYSGNSAYVLQTAASLTSTGNTFMRRRLNSTWGSWIKVWTAENDGAGSGLDADLLDGKTASNASGDIPISNGTVNANLNADLLDGFSAGSFVRTINSAGPDGGGNINVDLSSRLAKSGDTMSGQLVLNGGLRFNGTAIYIELYDTDWGMRHLHVSSGLVGFLKSDGNWGFYNDNSGNSWSAGNVSAYSDERLKDNWRDLPENFVELLAGVKMGVYDRTDEVGLTQVGVSAQSLQKVMPNAVTERDGMLSVAYGNAALAACVALAREVADLRAEVNALKAA